MYMKPFLTFTTFYHQTIFLFLAVAVLFKSRTESFQSGPADELFVVFGQKRENYFDFQTRAARVTFKNSMRAPHR